MKRYLLDTAPLAAVLHGRPAAVALVEPWMCAHEVATSSLVYSGEDYLYPEEYFMPVDLPQPVRAALHLAA